MAARDEHTGGNADLESLVEPMQTVQDVQQGAPVISPVFTTPVATGFFCDVVLVEAQKLNGGTSKATLPTY